VQYLHWLITLSVVFAALERLRPARRKQPVLRPQLGNDLFYLLFNGHFYAIVSAGVVGWISAGTRSVLESLALLPESGGPGWPGWIGGLPFAIQFAIFFALSDFLQWSIHVALHHVPLLWQFHKVHHSIHMMDWIGSFRFHWVEIVVYRSLLYVPLLLLGASGDVIFWVAVIGTAWGHFNHSNLDVGLGRLGLVFNSPRMHLWHHDVSDEGGASKNYGIVLSLWDFLFSTAYWPRERAPQRIGYAGDREMPADLPRQLAFPLTRRTDSG